jgi:ABC-type nitrate/sulfonate/bicarbonate transport system permease component
VPQLVAETLRLERPVLPAPHQVAAELVKSTFGMAPTSKNQLVYHGWITLSATLLGFAMGTLWAWLLAVGILHNRAMDMSVMPWAIASQTIPILAIAPMIIVVLNSVGLQGLVPKAIISAYLSFFPVVVGMVKGLRSPDQMQLDLLATYNASASDVFWKLRLARVDALSVHQSEGRHGGQSGGRDRGRIADRGGGGPWRAAAVGQLLWADRADLGGAVCGGDRGGGHGDADRPGRAADLETHGDGAMIWLAVAFGAWAVGWWVMPGWRSLGAGADPGGKLAVPVIFGLTILIVWEGLVRGLGVSPVILPPPSAVAARFAASLPTLWEDFVQTAVKGALSGYLIGCARRSWRRSHRPQPVPAARPVAGGQFRRRPAHRRHRADHGDVVRL